MRAISTIIGLALVLPAGSALAQAEHRTFRLALGQTSTDGGKHEAVHAEVVEALAGVQECGRYIDPDEAAELGGWVASVFAASDGEGGLLGYRWNEGHGLSESALVCIDHFLDDLRWGHGSDLLQQVVWVLPVEDDEEPPIEDQLDLVSGASYELVAPRLPQYVGRRHARGQAGAPSKRLGCRDATRGASFNGHGRSRPPGTPTRQAYAPSPNVVEAGRAGGEAAMNSQPRWRSWLVGAATLVVLGAAFLGLQVGYWLGLVGYLGNPTTPGEFGEMFGGFASFVGGLTLVLVIYSILLQRHELALQRDELRLQREEMRLQKEAIEHTRMYQAEPVLVPELEAHEWSRGRADGHVTLSGVLSIQNTSTHAAWRVDVWTGLHPFEDIGAEGSGQADLLLPGQRRTVKIDMTVRGDRARGLMGRLQSRSGDERPLLFARLRYRNMGGGLFETWRGIRLGLSESGEAESKGVLYRVKSGLDAELSAAPRQAIAGMLLSDRGFSLDRAQLAPET